LKPTHGIADFFRQVLAGGGEDKVGDNLSIRSTAESVALIDELLVEMAALTILPL
jgi:hypothetical protein